ncbi:MAG: class I adenylate-forming enzyme family protein [Chloroflexota bacterium]
MSGHVSTIAAIVEGWARERAGHAALASESGHVLRWGELGAEVGAARSVLRDLGIGRRARVAAAMPPGPRSALLFTTLAASAVVVPLLPDLTGPELDSLLPRLGLSAVVSRAGDDDRLAAAAARAGIPVLTVRPAAGDPFRFRVGGEPIGRAADPGLPEPADEGFIGATSGTTGRPKLIVRTHGQLAGVKHRGDPLLPVEPGWRTIIMAPLALSLGATALRLALADGGVAVAPSTLDPRRIPQLMTFHDPAWLFAPPRAIEQLAAACRDGSWRPGPSLRYLRCTSARLDPGVRSALPVPVFDAYASSEAGMVAREGFGVPHRPGFVGRIEAQVRIVEDGQLQPEGEPGEIQVSGPRVFAGYLDDPEATARAFTPDRWYRTGDRGYVRDGYLALLGRIDEVINSGGLKIDPAEIDTALLAYPGVRDAAAYPAPHPVKGQVAAAAVVLEPGRPLDRRALRRWLLDRIGVRKVPVVIREVESLPRTASGKVERWRLAEMHEAGSDATSR